MRKLRKMLAVMLAACVLFAAIPTSGLAEGGPTLSGAALTAKPGDTFEYSVYIENNPGIAGYRVKLAFDTSVFTLAADESDPALPYCAQGSFTSAGDLVCSSTPEGCQVLWYNTSNVTGSGTLFTVRLTAAEAAPVGEYPVAVSYTAKDTVNIDDARIAFSCENGNVALRAASPALYGESVTLGRGETAEISILICDNPGIAGFKLKLAVPAGLSVAMDPESGAPYCARGALTQKGALASALTTDGLQALWYGTADALGDGTLFTVKLTAAADAAPGAYSADISYESGDVLNAAEEDVALACRAVPIYVTEAAGSYIVSYDANGGTGAPAAQAKAAGSALTLSDDTPARQGYTFLGWAEDCAAQSAQYAPGGEYTKDASATLFAVWDEDEPSGLSASMSAGPYYPGSEITFTLSAVNAAKFTYTINKDQPDGTTAAVNTEGVSGTFAWTPAEAGTYYLNYTAHNTAGETASESSSFTVLSETVVTYAVSYDANGGTGAPAAQTKVADVSLTLSSAMPTRSGWQFLGWSRNRTAVQAEFAAGDAYTENAELTLYAVWKNVALGAVTITVAEEPPYIAGEPISFSASAANAARYTYTVTKPGSATPAAGPDLPLEGAASWTPASSSSYALSVTAYNVIGESKTQNMTITVAARSEAAPEIPALLIDVPYGGWYKFNTVENAEYYDLYIAKAPYTADDIVYGKMVQTAANVIDHSGTLDYSALEAGTYRVFAVSRPNDTILDISKSGELIYAGGTISSYAVVYDANGGSFGVVTQMKSKGKPVTLSEQAPTREGREFLGWGLSPDSATADYQPGDTYSADARLLLYALWSEAEPAASAIVGVDSVTASPGESVTVPVSISGNPGIAGFTLDVCYDASKLELTAVSAGSLLSAGTLTANTAENVATWTSAANIGGDGELLTLTFSVAEVCADGDYTISLALTDQQPSNFTDQLSEDVAVSFSPGKVTVRNTLPGDLTGDRDVTAADAVKLARALVRLTTLTDTEKKAADITGDGYVTSADAVKLARYLAGFITALAAERPGVVSLMSADADCAISVGELCAVRGESVTLPVYISGNPGIAGFAMTVSYDAEALSLTGIEAGAALSGGTLTPNVGGGMVTWSNAVNITGDGVLLELGFTVLSEAGSGAYPVAVALKELKPTNLCDEEGSAVRSAFSSGRIAVASAALRDAAVDGNSLSYSLSAEAQVDLTLHSIVIALYQGEKMCCCVLEDSPSTGVHTVELPGDVAYEDGKIFLLDAASSPGCEALRFSALA